MYCKTTGCDINDGSCECEVGYAGNPCTECPKNCDRTGCNYDFRCYACNPGFFDNFCNETCSQHCLNNTCNRDGRCHECDPGFYGDYCNLTCSTNCINGTCNRDGRCNCTVGYGGHPCEPCPKNCSDTGCNEQLICHECDPGFYGDYCNLTCSINCINGTCNRDGSCSCKEGFDGFGCCPENCEGGCNDTSFVCASCKPRHFSDLCNETCPDNCKDNCSRDGKTCMECKQNNWGATCQNDCPEKCSSQCDQNNGTCQCKAGFVGHHCPRKNCFAHIVYILNYSKNIFHVTMNFIL